MKHAWKSWLLCAALLVLIGFVGAVLAQQVWAQAKGPENFDFAGGPQGKVTYSHEKHAAKNPKCTDCHTKIFKMAKGQRSAPKMAEMEQGQSCGTCHNGQAAFSVKDKADCAKCTRSNSSRRTDTEAHRRLPPSPDLLRRRRDYCRRGIDRGRVHLPDVVVVIQDHPQGRGLRLHARTAPLPQTQHGPHLLHIHHRSHHLCTLARHETAVPAGAVIWILENVPFGSGTLATATVDWLNPFGMLLGLDGVILLAYIIAIPANEIVVPTMMMLCLGAGMMVDGPGTSTGIYELLLNGNGWTMLTAVNLMLFSLLHNPCATTIITIFKETKSYKWATVSVVITTSPSPRPIPTAGSASSLRSRSTGSGPAGMS